MLKMSAGEAMTAAESMLSELDVPDTTYVMLLHEEGLAGFAASRRVLEETLWVRYLLELHIDPRWRRKGLGRSLVADVRSTGESERSEGLMLTCDERRTVARKFYAAAGFVPLQEAAAWDRDTGDHMPGTCSDTLVLLWGDAALQTFTERNRRMRQPHDASPPATVKKAKRPRSQYSPPSEADLIATPRPAPEARRSRTHSESSPVVELT